MSPAVYDLPEVERVLPHRTIPAKGERVGIRALHPCGTPSKRRGFPWMPAIVERLTADRLYVRAPQTGLVIGLDLYDTWEIQPADVLEFWHFCRTCRGEGEIYQWRDPVDPAKDVKVSCVECGGWGEIGEHPFKVSRRTKQYLAAKAEDAAIAAEARLPVTTEQTRKSA